jgi:outer membrane protein assembly factor BamB
MSFCFLTYGVAMINRLQFKKNLSLIICVLLVSFAGRGWSVTSKVTRQSTGVELLKGQTDNVVISSRGTIQLGRAAKVLVEEFDDVWSVNCITISGGTVYLGTSPNGNIYKYSLGKLTKMYPLESDAVSQGHSVGQASPKTKPDSEQDELADANDVDSETIDENQYLLNEHIFAMATDVAGRVLAGISGSKCKLIRFEAGKIETIFEPNDAKYIYAITIDVAGDIYLGTGPEGKVYKLDPLGKNFELIYDSIDKNILSLAVDQDGFVYAGGDTRGLVYKINPRTKTATVLYDSDQPEITALLISRISTAKEGDLYAAATSAKIIEAETAFADQMPQAGRPEPPNSLKPENTAQDGRKLQIANTKEHADDKPAKPEKPIRKRPKPSEASHLYRIDKEGYVVDVFEDALVFFCLAEQDGKLLVGTGNDAQLLDIDPVTEQETIIYEDEQASQITAVAISGQVTYLGTANPAKLIKLNTEFASEGTYTSDLIDAGQPANWGKLQVEADIPQGCRILVASRSGNVDDANDTTFSEWTEPVEVTGPVQLDCPLGRFCQYKLVLQSEDGLNSPVIREVAVASTVPNLAPRIEAVDVSRVQAPGKTGIFKIDYKAMDDNGDNLIYKIDFRKTGRTNWIQLEDEIEADNFEWDGKTVEDGRYEIRVTADDSRSNTVATKLTGSRISDPAVVDNTGPVIEDYSISENETTVTLKLRLADQISAIGELHYTVDSNAEWKGAIPDDLVCDTLNENFTIVVENLSTGEHIIAVRTTDAVGNTTYKTFELNVPN